MEVGYTGTIALKIKVLGVKWFREMIIGSKVVLKKVYWKVSALTKVYCG